MEDDRNCRLKISVDNLNSEDEETASSASGEGESFRGTKTGTGSHPPPHSPPAAERESSTDDNHSRDRDSDQDTINVSAVDSEIQKFPKQRIKTYKNEAGTFVVGFDVTSQECLDRQKLRAERFGDAVSSLSPVTDEAIQKLYESLGVSPSTDSGENIVRFDAVHIRGVDEMSTSRVFSYFGEFPPASVEWIDDTSCNVVWMDTMMAIRAFLKLSYDPASSENPIVNNSVPEEKEDNNDDAAPASDISDKLQPAADSTAIIEIEDDDDLDLLSDDDIAKLSHSTVTAEENQEKNSKSVKINQEEEDMEVDEDIAAQRQPGLDKQSSIDKKVTRQKKKIQKIHMNEDKGKIPPGKWRVGIPHPRAKLLFMRFATKADIKLQGAGKRSRYYQKYGNPNFGGIKGIISESRKRKMFSKQYHVELEEARKAIEEAKWKRGIPDETKFDQHLEEVVLKRERKKEEPPAFTYSSGDDDGDDGSSNELVVEAVDAPKKKRFMKMHADEIEERSLSRRLGPCNNLNSKSNVRDRLGVGRQSLGSTDSSHDAGNSRRKIGDLRNRLNQR